MRFLLDVDYIAFAVLMGVFGIVGITATANVTPNIFAASTCNCIPSPVVRLQGLSVILLAFSLVLAPVGLLKRPTGGLSVQSTATPGAGYSALSMRSGGIFFLGVSLVVFGIALVAVPSFLVLGNRLLIGEGAAMVAFGVFLAYRGGRSS
ncbi:MAG: hypothetical protein OK442_01250 [Thaumarchaeota archaeon]|nr:hypothetical protein [Nitrososphaerota archaeon]